MKIFKKGYELGASLIEYTFGLALIAVIFVVIGVDLDATARTRRDKALKVAEEIIPCDTGAFSGDECL